MRLLVCGGRSYRDVDFAYAVLDMRAPTLIIEGGSTGADSIARDWAGLRGIPCMTFQAPWERDGRRAGPMRNAWMIEHGKPDAVLAFPGGIGTANMVKQAKVAGLPVEEIK